ncbi:hypothetical protein [Methylovulum psychrotolerans]|uniref:Uncharacterized protein n=1 Tax=Methylovulum psychrotolerans TaxID=1704499 RepID=A0A2S5CQH8_9GAMM|nr:hypothetical protein [Methylovulum psychrotolerans]POZ53007.1 hypothetical protein AADEFJLK_00016 [Methylovulum psychrotolerans]
MKNSLSGSKLIATALYLASALLISLTQPVYACKSLVGYPDYFPLEKIISYPQVYVVKVTAIKPDQPDSWYGPPFSLTGQIVQTLKGPGKPGDTLQAETKTDEEANARCPVILDEGKTYLLMLEGTEMPYKLPRYGLYYLSSDHPRFKIYMADIKRGLKKRGK